MLQMFLLLPLIYYVIFHYIPMYGVTVAFKDFKFMSGILGSPWIGLDNFRRFGGRRQTARPSLERWAMEVNE